MTIKWKIFEKSGGRMGKYSRYLDRVVLITTDRCLIFTPATIELLGKPNRVLLLHDGNGHMGIKPVKENDPEYDNAFSVQYPDRVSKKPTGKATIFINCRAFLEECKINPKMVFSTISIENNILVVDMTKPEVLKVNN